jgi:hypothetical protein
VILQWREENCFEWRYIAPRKPTQSSFVEIALSGHPCGASREDPLAAPLVAAIEVAAMPERHSRTNPFRGVGQWVLALTRKDDDWRVANR